MNRLGAFAPGAARPPKKDASLLAMFALGGFAVAGCATSSGVPAPAIPEAQIAAAYIPLHRGGLTSAEGAAVTIAPGIAVTNDHNENLIDPKAILGFGSASDLLFFRTPRDSTPPTAAPALGKSVVAYGQGTNGDLRVARGVICDVVHVSGHTDSPYFIFVGDAGPGFSGGPVLDANGHLIGITWGYMDDPKNRRLMFAYDMTRVRTELELKKPKKYEPKSADSSPPATANCEELLGSLPVG